MGKIGLIIKREYITRVRKPAFIVLTILGPVLFAALTVLPIIIAQYTDETKTIGVVDRSMIFFSALKEKETENLKFVFIPQQLFDKEKAQLDSSGLFGILYIPVTESGDYSQLMYKENQNNTVNFYSDKNMGIGLKSFIEDVLKEEIRGQELIKQDIPRDIVEKTSHKVVVDTKPADEKAKDTNKSTELNTGLGLGLGMVIYIFIFIYGAMVMRGVIEEKTSRIVEVIVSSVKPFQLMMGKIIGIGLVGLTQFVAWIILSIFVSIGAQTMLADKYDSKNVAQQTTQELAPGKDIAVKEQMEKNQESGRVLNQIMALPFGKIAFAFLFFFLGGYLLYASFFAAIGGAVDSETDTQQFMLPITIPIIFSFVMIQFVLNNPDGPVAFWLSMIPLTSPVIMMVRVPFDPPMWQVVLSMAILVITFVLSTWLAGRIYRTGILMYGKKPSWRELGKWLFYKG